MFSKISRRRAFVSLQNQLYVKEKLIGNFPIELSHSGNFLTTVETINTLTAEVIGKIKREIGLVYPAK